MRKLINSITNIGLYPELPFNLQNKIRIYNVACLFISTICVFYSVLDILLHLYLGTILTATEFLLLLFGLFLVYKRKYNLAFHFMLINGTLFLFGFSLLFGEKIQSHIYLLFIPVAGIILFDNFKTILFYFFLAVAFLLLSKVMFDSFTAVYPDNPFIGIIGWLNLVFTAALIFLGVRQFKTENIAFTKEINLQRMELKEKNKDITDSIHYAQRIQKALMASNNLLNKNLAEYFVFYRPKDIISGDFYWAEETDSGFLLAACDCTGHGVPGAFMSLLNITKLNETVHEKKIMRPDLILNQVREDIIKVLNPEGTKEAGRDGMDAVCCRFDFVNLKLEFACSNNPLWIVRKMNNIELTIDNDIPQQLITNNYQLIEYKPDKMPVGMYTAEKSDFTLNSIELQKGDIVYLFTDGYADQFGGAKGKKFKYAQLKEVLLSVYHLSMREQELALNQKLESWKGNLEQVDDILIIGVRI